MDLPNGFRRTTAIKDIDAPADIVFGQIIDVASYPRKIDGVIGTDIYSDARSLSGTRTFCARYRVRFATLVAESFVKHEYDGELTHGSNASTGRTGVLRRGVHDPAHADPASTLADVATSVRSLLTLHDVSP